MSGDENKNISEIYDSLRQLHIRNLELEKLISGIEKRLIESETKVSLFLKLLSGSGLTIGALCIGLTYFISHVTSMQDDLHKDEVRIATVTEQVRDLPASIKTLASESVKSAVLDPNGTFQNQIRTFSDYTDVVSSQRNCPDATQRIAGAILVARGQVPTQMTPMISPESVRFMGDNADWAWLRLSFCARKK